MHCAQHEALFHNLVSDVGMCVCIDAGYQCNLQLLFGVMVNNTNKKKEFENLHPREESAAPTTRMEARVACGPVELNSCLSLEGI